MRDRNLELIILLFNRVSSRDVHQILKSKTKEPLIEAFILTRDKRYKNLYLLTIFQLSSAVRLEANAFESVPS